MLRGLFGVRYYGGSLGYTGRGRVFKDWQDASDQLCDWLEMNRISSATKETVIALKEKAEKNSIVSIFIFEEDENEEGDANASFQSLLS